MNVEINIAGMSLKIEGEFFPVVPARVLGPVETCHPGEDARFEIEAVRNGDADITALVMDSNLLVRLPGSCEKGCPMASLQDLIVEAALEAAEKQHKEAKATLALAKNNEEN